jgi:hypothetical protein
MSVSANGDTTETRRSKPNGGSEGTGGRGVNDQTKPTRKASSEAAM